MASSGGLSRRRIERPRRESFIEPRAIDHARFVLRERHRKTRKRWATYI